MRAIGLFTFGPPDVLQPVEIPTPEPGPGDDDRLAVGDPVIALVLPAGPHGGA
jgi:hypothetical protein